MINDIQRELARRGYYEGPIDGLYGPRTDVAIREFEQAAGLKTNAQPDEALLRAIMRSHVYASASPATSTGSTRPSAPPTPLARPASAPPRAAAPAPLAAPAAPARPAVAAPQAAATTPAPLVPPLAAGTSSALSSRRIIAVQRALSDFGYGQLKPNGVIGAETKNAIERFEHERKLPVTGQISDRLVRELAAVTGRPLE